MTHVLILRPVRTITLFCQTPINNWLVVSTAVKYMSSSIGMMKFPICGMWKSKIHVPKHQPDHHLPEPSHLPTSRLLTRRSKRVSCSAITCTVLCQVCPAQKRMMQRENSGWHIDLCIHISFACVHLYI